MTPTIADRFGVVKAQLRSRGRLKADFDLTIVATALELGATLVTAARHYARTEAIENAVQERVLEKFTVVHKKANGSCQIAQNRVMLEISAVEKT